METLLITKEPLAVLVLTILYFLKNVLPNKTEYTESPLLSGFVGLLALGFLYFT